jgi:branched-chain amino acid transport system ATP-binding protein
MQSVGSARPQKGSLSAEQGGTPMLELRTITAGYGTTTILRDVNLSVPSSSVVALLGPNGAGKTTLLRVASGLIRPTGGQVFMDGVEVTRRPSYALARTGMCHLPEGRGIFPSLTVRENLVLLSPRGRQPEAIEEALEMFPALGRRLRQHAGSMSGGEQQMLALVRAVVTKPKLVVVDEASLGLSPLVVDTVFDALRRIVASGTSLLLVEQYVARALDLAETTYLLNRGKIVFSGPSSNLRDSDLFEQYLGIDGPASSARSALDEIPRGQDNDGRS